MSRARARVLTALEAIDLGAISEDDTPLGLIRRLLPSVLVNDYRKETVVGHELVEADGGKVILSSWCPEIPSPASCSARAASRRKARAAMNRPRAERRRGRRAPPGAAVRN
jgi:hypothetical protein